MDAAGAAPCPTVRSTACLRMENGPAASCTARALSPYSLDEVQYAPGLFRHLKAAVDHDRGRAGAFLLTGSQPIGLMKSVSDSLAGRAGIVELEPLSFAEARAAHPNLAAEESLVRSGFPELYENLEIESEGFLRSYVAALVKRPKLYRLAILEPRALGAGVVRLSSDGSILGIALRAASGLPRPIGFRGVG